MLAANEMLEAGEGVYKGMNCVTLSRAHCSRSLRILVPLNHEAVSK